MVSNHLFGSLGPEFLDKFERAGIVPSAPSGVSALRRLAEGRRRAILSRAAARGCGGHNSISA
jgi:hypothetical protein